MATTLKRKILSTLFLILTLTLALTLNLYVYQVFERLSTRENVPWDVCGECWHP